MHMYFTVPFMCLKYPFLHVVMCIGYHRWRGGGGNTLSVFSNAALGLLKGDSARFRSSGSVLGLRVHNSVRCNYEELIPGKPVWHFIHDVSYSYLIYCSLRTAWQMDRTLKYTHTPLPCWHFPRVLVQYLTHTLIFLCCCLALFRCVLRSALPSLIRQ